MFDFFRRRRRGEILQQPFPAAWRDIIARNVPYLARLDAAGRATLEKKIQIFLAEKKFEGCGGLTVDDEMRVTIAAQACLLALHHEVLYPRLASILVYPASFVTGERVETLGQSSGLGAVVLAWDEVLKGAQNTRDGTNVALHEFAHQLDQEDGAANGAPILERRSQYAVWAQAFAKDYEDLVRDVQRGRSTTLDPYGATSPAEFFAVVTEAFFERPHDLRREHGALYEQLREYYRQDPASALPAPR